MIIAHNQFDLLELLLRRLDDSRNDIFVHIDAKVKDFDFDYFASVTKCSRLIFTPERVNITWGDFSQVECEMLLLKTAVKNEDADNPYSYFHLLSGVDLPIKTNDEIFNFFERQSPKEFIHYTNGGDDGSSAARIKYYHFFRRKRNLLFKILAQIVLRAEMLFGVDRLKGTDIKVRKGCNWFSITGALAHYVVDNQEKYKKHFKYSYCGDEIFIQTIVESSEFKRNVFMPDSNDDHYACARLIDWKRGNPYVFRKEDYELIKASPCMFARKFDMNVDSEIVKLLTQ